MMEDSRRSGGVPDLSGQLPNERTLYRGFESSTPTRGTRGRGAWRGRGGYRGRGRGRGASPVSGGDRPWGSPNAVNSANDGEWAMAMDWDGESFDGEGDWPAPGSGMDFDPWGGGTQAMSGSETNMHAGGDRERAGSPLRARSVERERERERSPPRRPSHDLVDRNGRPDWKRHQRPADHDYNTTIDLIARGICKFWNTSRGCSRGNFCKYRHLTREDEERERYQDRYSRNDRSYNRERSPERDRPRERARSRERENDWSLRSSRGDSRASEKGREETHSDRADANKDRDRQQTDDRKRKRDEDETEAEKAPDVSKRPALSVPAPTPTPTSSTSLPVSVTSPTTSSRRASESPPPNRDITSFPSLHEFLATVKQEAKKETSHLDHASLKEKAGSPAPTTTTTTTSAPAGSTVDNNIPFGPAPPPTLTSAVDAATATATGPALVLPAPPGMVPTAGDLALYPAYVQACEKMKELLGECESLKKAKDALEKEKVELKAKVIEARDGKLTKDVKERLVSYEDQIEDLRKQRYVLLKKNSELKDKIEELTRSADHIKKNNAELRKQNEGLRDKVDELEAKARSSKSSKDKSTASVDKKESVKTEPTPTSPTTTTTTTTTALTSTPTELQTQVQQAAVDEAAAAKIAELEKTTGDLLRKNLELVRKNVDLIKRFKESEANNIALQTALAEANKVVESLRHTCAGLQSKVGEMEQEEIRRKREKVEKRMKRLEQQLAAENKAGSVKDDAAAQGNGVTTTTIAREVDGTAQMTNAEPTTTATTASMLTQ